jgi:hypothetical protein
MQDFMPMAGYASRRSPVALIVVRRNHAHHG